jgi:Tfp pilus assembly protein PilX
MGKSKSIRTIQKNSGSVLLMVLVFVLIFAFLSIFALRMIVNQSVTDEVETIRTRLFYAADGTLERSMYLVTQYEGFPSTHTVNWNNSAVIPTALYQAVLTKVTLPPGPNINVSRTQWYIDASSLSDAASTVDAARWTQYDSETHPPIKTRAVLREEVDPFNTPEYRDSDGWQINDGWHALSQPGLERRYYRITAEASLYNPSAPGAPVYGEVYSIAAHICIERVGDGTAGSPYRYNYIFRSRKRL